MPKFKNIRIKKKGGGFRMQRVQVLKSGKLKFVKNKPVARARSRLKATKRRVRGARRAVRTQARRTRTMARRRRKAFRRGKKMTLPVGLLVPGGIATWMTFKSIWEKAGAGDMRGALRRTIKHSIGYDIDAKKFNLADAWLPLGWGSGVVIHKGIGGMLGVNRALGAAKVPIFRL